MTVTVPPTLPVTLPLTLTLGSYNEIFSTIEKSERLEAYREPCARIKASAKVGAALGLG